MSTPHPLDGARLKVVRAQEHLKSFNEEAWRYMSAEPYEIVPKREANNVTIECIITAEPPPRLACIVGDLVTNLRASLDYIAWELAMLAGNPLTEVQQKQIAFPIAPTQVSFTQANGTADRLERVCGVPAATISVIESVQPYHAGYEPLRNLNLLVNRDKHRMLLLCCSVVLENGDLSFFQGSRLCWRTQGGIKSIFNLDTWGPQFAEGTPPLNVKVESKPTVLIAIKDFPVPPTPTFVGILEDAIKCVANIIPRFEPLFP
jgi:hypothetical protein